MRWPSPSINRPSTSPGRAAADENPRDAGKPKRLILFAAGDFACNLYWQSVTLFLFFFYTDVLILPPATAGVIAMIGALWDGLADFAVGILAQRARSYRRFITAGSIPLGLAFVALFLAPAWDAPAVAALALAAQLLFRTLYAVVNVPYAAWSARISEDSRDRATVAGLRMLFGTAAATLVALTMPRTGYAIAAAGYAAIAVPLLWFVALRSREAAPVAPVARVSVHAYLAVLARNRAFVTLNLAMAIAGIAAAIVNQSVLYYFDHVVTAPAAGRAALAMMSVGGAACIPLWMLVAQRAGPRATWFLASAVGIAALVGHAVAGGEVAGTQALLMGLQAAFAGLNLTFWAMLPDTVDYGEAHSGVRVEGVAFGVAALIQKIALAAAAAAMGLAYTRIGYVAGGTQPATDAGIRTLMLATPAVGLVLAALAMAANPLSRGVHARLVAALRRGPE